MTDWIKSTKLEKLLLLLFFCFVSFLLVIKKTRKEEEKKKSNLEMFKLIVFTITTTIIEKTPLQKNKKTLLYSRQNLYLISIKMFKIFIFM